MRRDVERFCRNCHSCKRAQTSRHAPFEILRSLSIPEEAWQNLSMNFVIDLSRSDENNAILIVVCRLTKMRHLIFCKNTVTIKQLAELYIRHVFRLHGLPRSIVFDRGPQFIAAFWRALCKILKVQVQLSTPYHAQIDGQTERFNAVMEQYLRSYVSYLQDN